MNKLALSFPYFCLDPNNKTLDNVYLYANYELSPSGHKKIKCPGGHVEKNESFEVAAMRELSEEWLYPLKNDGTPFATNSCIKKSEHIQHLIKGEECTGFFFINLNQFYNNMDEIKKNIIDHHLIAKKEQKVIKYDKHGNVLNNGEKVSLTEFEQEVIEIFPVTLKALRDAIKNKGSLQINEKTECNNITPNYKHLYNLILEVILKQ